MATERHLYHLTPAGWVEHGNNREVPQDRLLTVNCTPTRCNIVWESDDLKAILDAESEHGIAPPSWFGGEPT